MPNEKDRKINRPRDDTPPAVTAILAQWARFAARAASPADALLRRIAAPADAC
jgi:hypothetical protein